MDSISSYPSSQISPTNVPRCAQSLLDEAKRIEYKDDVKAYELYSEAANDSAEAQYHCGRMLWEGRGVLRNFVAAIKCISATAKQGHVEAERFLEAKQTLLEEYVTHANAPLCWLSGALSPELQEILVEIILSAKKGEPSENLTITRDDICTVLEDLSFCLQETMGYPQEAVDSFKKKLMSNLAGVLKQGVEAYNHGKTMQVAIVVDDLSTHLLPECWGLIERKLSFIQSNCLTSTSKTHVEIASAHKAKEEKCRLIDFKPGKDYSDFFKFYEEFAVSTLKIRITIKNISEGEESREWFRQFCDSLANNKNIETLMLDLLGPKLDAEDFKYLAKLVKLTYLYLLANELGSDGAKALALSLSDLKNLKTLGLWANKFGSDGAKALAPALAELKNLKQLDLKINELGSDGIEALAPALTKLKELIFLSFCSNNLDLGGAKILASTLPELTSLTALNLVSNKFGSEGAEALAPSLAKLTNLTALNLSNNNLGFLGAKALASKLAELTSITRLSLSDNNLGPDAAEALAPALAKLTNLTLLDFARNKLGRDGIKTLTLALQLTNPALLRFEHNTL